MDRFIAIHQLFMTINSHDSQCVIDYKTPLMLSTPILSIPTLSVDDPAYSSLLYRLLCTASTWLSILKPIPISTSVPIPYIVLPYRGFPRAKITHDSIARQSVPRQDSIISYDKFYTF